eukprot:3295229-Pleurochrysis_carterae.AAC.2
MRAPRARRAPARARVRVTFSRVRHSHQQRDRDDLAVRLEDGTDVLRLKGGVRNGAGTGLARGRKRGGWRSKRGQRQETGGRGFTRGTTSGCRGCGRETEEGGVIPPHPQPPSTPSSAPCCRPPFAAPR